MVTTTIRRPFDCLSKVIKVSVMKPASRSHVLPSAVTRFRLLHPSFGTAPVHFQIRQRIFDQNPGDGTGCNHRLKGPRLRPGLRERANPADYRPLYRPLTVRRWPWLPVRQCCDDAERVARRRYDASSRRRAPGRVSGTLPSRSWQTRSAIALCSLQRQGCRP